MSSERPPELRKRGGQLVLVAVIAVAVVGFLVGIDDGVPQSEIADPGGSLAAASASRTAASRTAAAGTAADGTGGGEAAHGPTSIPATAYAELRSQRIGANSGFRSRVEDLRPASPAGPDALPDAGVEKRARPAAVAGRAELRAFAGAPPVIPHAADQLTSTACMACHREGLELAGQRAGGVPHPSFTNCLQCHVPASPLEAPNLLAASRFLGLASPGDGVRAWEGAPPTVPHTTWMRGSCIACHGLQGPEGLRTSHPERVMCLQCHAPAADLDQGPGGAPLFLGAVGP